MLLGVVKGELSSWELVVDLAGDVALEAADGFFLGASLCESTVDVGAGAFIADHAGDDDVSERGVGVAVAAAVESVSFLFAAGGVDRGDPAEVGKVHPTANRTVATMVGDRLLPASRFAPRERPAASASSWS